MQDKTFRRLILILWPVVLVALGIPALAVHDRVGEPNLTVSGSASERADQILDERFPGSTAVAILLEGPADQVRIQGTRLATELDGAGYGPVVTPWTDDSVADVLAPEPGTALLLAMTGGSEGAMKDADVIVDRVDEVIADPVAASITGEGVVGSALEEAGVRELRKGELYALPLLIVILLLVFRSLLAAAIPIVIGGSVLIATSGVLSVLAGAVSLDSLAISIASMMSLALGVDYSLLIVSRFREELARGLQPWEAAALARRTAGRTVVEAGCVLLAAVSAALLVAPGPFLVSATVAVGAAAVMSVIAAVGIVPVLLGFAGRRINGRRGTRTQETEGGVVLRACRLALRRPVPVGLLVLLVLIPLSLPALGMRTGTPGVELLTKGERALADYTRISEVMGPGWSAPFIVVAQNPDGPVTTPALLTELSELEGELRETEGVAEVLGAGAVADRLLSVESLDPPALLSAARSAGVDVGPMIAQSPNVLQSGYLGLAALDGARSDLRGLAATVVNIDLGGDTARFVVVPDAPAGSPEAVRLSDELRSAAESLAESTGMTVVVGGSGQLVVDFGKEITRLVPLLLLVLSGASYLVLVVLLRSLLVPLVAVLLNVLTVGAAFGVLALLYDGTVGPEQVPVYIAGTAVLGIMGIMFGLSIDYQVFMLSRIREAWLRTGDPIAAINGGIVGTARVITGAALVMIAVFTGFALTTFPVNRQLGIGLVVAVLVDATLLRLLLLPGALKLLGARAWWWPGTPRPQVRTEVEPERQELVRAGE